MEEDNFDSVIGGNIRKMRIDNGKTLENVVKAMQVCGYKWSTTTLSNIERGTRPLRASEIFDLLHCLGFEDPVSQLSVIYETPTESRLNAEVLWMRLARNDFEIAMARYKKTRDKLIEMLDSEEAAERFTVATQRHYRELVQAEDEMMKKALSQYSFLESGSSEVK
ncbi:helix-turn-helix transcriptional regulator [Bifidobacterium imperatoris]|nr:helix-turn-helix transcriptional regulator [Bifidobacterium imperatoris]QSY58161.1 helix-turn-helix transcriptional regulator [Bifidobacterium imperatoris]